MNADKGLLNDWILIDSDQIHQTDEHVAVTKFRQYLRIDTRQPSPNYQACSEFLREYAKEIGLDYKQVEVLISLIKKCVKGKPICIMTLIGTDRSLKSVILNSHTGF
jgi:acetylornithine deacetylase/succinyl-diaminopimelate desuccinylase-like protein